MRNRENEFFRSFHAQLTPRFKHISVEFCQNSFHITHAALN